MIESTLGIHNCYVAVFTPDGSYINKARKMAGLQAGYDLQPIFFFYVAEFSNSLHNIDITRKLCLDMAGRFVEALDFTQKEEKEKKNRRKK